MSSPHVVSKPDKLVDSLLEKIHEQQQMILILEGELQTLHNKVLLLEGGVA